MYQYTGRNDTMRASKDNLSSDALDKQIRVMIKIPHDVRSHVCNIDIQTGGAGTTVSLPTNHQFPLHSCKFSKDFAFVCSA
jgi:hypothetical protein